MRVARDLTDEEELFDAIDGLFAYDSGAVDSGIHDEKLRMAVQVYLLALLQTGRGPHRRYSPEFSALLGRYIDRFFLGKEAIARGYGLEDLQGFMRWLHERMGIPA